MRFGCDETTVTSCGLDGQVGGCAIALHIFVLFVDSKRLLGSWWSGVCIGLASGYDPIKSWTPKRIRNGRVKTHNHLVLLNVPIIV